MSEERSDMPSIVMATKDLSFFAYDERIQHDHKGELITYIRADHPVLIQCVEALQAVRGIIAEGAAHGMNAVKHPEWAMRLYESNQATSQALSAFEKMKGEE